MRTSLPRKLMDSGDGTLRSQFLLSSPPECEFPEVVFRPCIDLHEGKVKQIVGGTLSDDPTTLRTNFVSERSAAWYAELYKRDGLRGGHIILLGPGNESAAREAPAAYPRGLPNSGGSPLENTARA